MTTEWCLEARQSVGYDSNEWSVVRATKPSRDSPFYVLRLLISSVNALTHDVLHRRSSCKGVGMMPYSRVNNVSL